MSELAVALFQSIVPIFVLVMFGLALRRLGAIGEKGNDILSRAVIYFFFPILVFHRLALTEEPSTLLSDWLIHVWAVIILIGSGLIGLFWHKLTHSNADRRMFVFMVGMPNWIYLPLALAGPLWGDEAVRLIILFNIPTQILLWTVGIWLLHGTLRGMHVLKYIFLNPGFISTAAGLAVAFELIPMTFQPDGKGLSLVNISPVLHMIGGLTIPLSLVALGLYLGERGNQNPGAWRDIGLVTIGRIFIAPIILGASILFSVEIGLSMSSMLRWVLYLIVAMPVAVSAPMFAQMFGRDRHLASRGVVISSMISFASAPLFVILFLKLEVWLGLADGGFIP